MTEVWEQRRSSSVLQPWRTEELVEMAAASYEAGSGWGNWRLGQAAPKTNEVGKLKYAGLCPWNPSVRITETLEMKHPVLV